MHWRLEDLWHRVRASLPGGRSAEMDEELRFHLDMATARNVAHGMSPDEALHAVLTTTDLSADMMASNLIVQRKQGL